MATQCLFVSTSARHHILGRVHELSRWTSFVGRRVHTGTSARATSGNVQPCSASLAARILNLMLQSDDCVRNSGPAASSRTLLSSYSCSALLARMRTNRVSGQGGLSVFFASSLAYPARFPLSVKRISRKTSESMPAADCRPSCFEGQSLPSPVKCPDTGGRVSVRDRPACSTVLQPQWN